MCMIPIAHIPRSSHPPVNRAARPPTRSSCLTAKIFPHGKDIRARSPRQAKWVRQEWKLERRILRSSAEDPGDLATKEKFGDCQLHVEWSERPDITGSSQGRGNSGILLMGLYEVQVLDSYQSKTYADGQAGALYGQWPPLANAMRKPGEWNV